MRKIKLGEVLDVKRGCSLSGDYYSTEGEYVRLTLGNFSYPDNGFKLNTSKDNLFYTGDFKEEFLLKEGDIITPLTEQVRGLLGNTATIPESNKYIQSGDIGLIIPNEELLNKRYAYYLVSSPIIKKQLDAGSQQTKIRHTNPDAIKSCVAYIPDLKTQEKIARILDDINSKIAVNKKINDNLQQLLSISYQRSLASSKNRLIKIQLKDIIEEIREPLNTKDNIPTIDLSVMPSNSFSLHNLNHSDNFETNLFRMYKGNLLFGSIRPYLKKAGVAPCDGAVAGTVIQFKVKEEKFYNLALYTLTSNVLFQYAVKNSHGTKMPVVASDRILEYPIEYSDEFINNSSLLNLIKTIPANCVEINALEKVKECLLPLLLNGQATIR